VLVPVFGYTGMIATVQSLRLIPSAKRLLTLKKKRYFSPPHLNKAILMRTALLFVLLTCLAPSLTAQTRARDGERFVKALNELAAYSKPNGFSYFPYTVDSAFHLVGDSLTFTYSYKDDYFTGRQRYILPLNKVHSVGHDLNLVLYANDEAVQIYEQAAGAKEWTFRGTYHLVLIGQVDDDNRTQQKMKRKIEAAWQKMLRWYPPQAG
jgi:hypothetical protein